MMKVNLQGGFYGEERRAATIESAEHHLNQGEKRVASFSMGSREAGQADVQEDKQFLSAQFSGLSTEEVTILKGSEEEIEQLLKDEKPTTNMLNWAIFRRSASIVKMLLQKAENPSHLITKVTRYISDCVCDEGIQREIDEIYPVSWIENNVFEPEEFEKLLSYFTKSCLEVEELDLSDHPEITDDYFGKIEGDFLTPFKKLNLFGCVRVTDLG